MVLAHLECFEREKASEPCHRPPQHALMLIKPFVFREDDRAIAGETSPKPTH